MSKYTIRLARETDLDRVTELVLALQDHLETCNRDLWRMTDLTRANLKGQLAGRLQAPNACALVAEHEQDGVIGVAFGRVVANKSYVPSRAGQVDQAFVRADHRRGGVGAELMAEICQFFAQEEVEDVSVRYVIGNEHATGFWTALGFAPRIVTSGTGRQVVEARVAEIQAR